jgi:hypothetical protein
MKEREINIEKIGRKKKQEKDRKERLNKWEETDKGIEVER